MGLGSVDTPLGLGSILPAAKLDAFKNMAYASAARAGASGLYAAKQLADASEKAQKRQQSTEPEPASRDDLMELSVSQLKKLARDNDVDVSMCLEKSNIVDALVLVKVPLPPDHPKRIANTPKSPEEDMKARRRRAAALKLFADALHAASSEVSVESSEVEPEKRFEHAMNVTMAAAMGQEMSEGHGDAMPPTV